MEEDTALKSEETVLVQDNWWRLEVKAEETRHLLDWTEGRKWEMEESSISSL